MGLRRAIADLGWRLARYRLVGGEIPRQPGIIIGGPHTSQWDFVAFVGVMWHFEAKMKILVKKSFFRFPPLAMLMRALGGISVDREHPGGVVEQLSRRATGGSPYHIVLAPKGTRKPQPFWKSGFYRLALATGLPVTLAAIDGPRREVTIGPTLRMTGDVSADMDRIRAFYADKRGVRPQLRSEPRLAAELDSRGGRPAARLDTAGPGFDAPTPSPGE